MESSLIQLTLTTAIHAGNEILDVYQSEFAIEHKEDKSPLTLADKRSHEIIQHALAQTGIPVLSEEGRNIPYSERKQWKKLWIVDPLDGTKEFIKRNGEFTVNIALVEDGYAEWGIIYQPVADLLYFSYEGNTFKITNARSKKDEELLQHAEKIIPGSSHSKYTIAASRSHLSPETASYIEEVKKNHGEIDFISAGSSLKLCLVAEGRAQEYPRFAPTMEWDTAAGHAILRSCGKNIYSWKDKSELRYNKPDLLNDWFIAK